MPIRLSTDGVLVQIQAEPPSEGIQLDVKNLELLAGVLNDEKLRKHLTLAINAYLVFRKSGPINYFEVDDDGTYHVNQG